MIKIAFSTSKGGVGKTVLSLEFAAGLKRRGRKCLLMDMDCQGSLSAACGLDIESDMSTIKDVLDDKLSLKDAIIESPIGLPIVANNILTFDADRQYTQLGALRRIRKLIATVEDEYEYVILDTQPSFSFQTLSSLIAADCICIPQLASMFSGLSLKQLNSMLELIRAEENPNLKIAGIVLTKWNPRTRFNRDFLEVLEIVAKEMDTSVYDAKIRQAISVEESVNEHEDIWTYAPGSKVAGDYDAFVDETLVRIDALMHEGE